MLKKNCVRLSSSKQGTFVLNKTHTIMNTGKIVLGALAGLAVGAALGILFAPEKGSTTRKQITNKGDDYLDELKSKFNSLCNAVSEKLDLTKQEAEDFVNKGKAILDEVKG
jgi:gas vesicle protein